MSRDHCKHLRSRGSLPNFAAVYRVADARRLATVARAPDKVLYLAADLASREAVATRKLPRLASSWLDLGLKDLVLPGEVKALLNRVIEAQKEAEANLILRRERPPRRGPWRRWRRSSWRTRCLVWLNELEGYKELGGRVGG